MKNNFKKISAVLVAGALMAPQAFAQTKSLEERVSELEANQSLNIFSFSGTFQTRWDDLIKLEQNSPSTDNLGQSAVVDRKGESYMRMKFQLEIDANVSKYIKFYSRLTTSKNFNSFYQQGYADSNVGGNDLTAPNDYRSSGVFLEKAYVDLSLPETNFTLSIGRLPTVDGQPQNYKDGRARMGTYPQLSYDSVLDGFALSYKADEYMPTDHKLAARVIYTPFSQYNVGTGGYVSGVTNQAGSKLNTQIDTTAAMIDYSNDNKWGMDNFGLVLMYFQTGSLYYPSPATALGNSTLNLNVGGTTIATEFNGIAHTGWDLSASYLFSSLKSHGTLAGMGFGTASSDDTETGGVLLISTRYRLASWILGAEYVNGSEDSFYYAGNEEDLTNFYSTKGNAYHVYVTKKFTSNLSLRVGYMDQEYKWTPTGLGANKDSDRKIQTGYANMRLDF